MDYKKIYEDLVTKAQFENRVKVKRNDELYVYYERHHINPRCLDGDNSKENLVLLTAREHYLVHKLLVEIYPGNKSLIYALSAMMRFRKKDRGLIISSKEYEKIKIEVVALKLGVPRSEETRRKVGETRKKNNFSHTQEAKDAISLGHMGKILSEETKAKISISRTGIIFSDEHKSNISKAKKGSTSWSKGLTGIHSEEALQKLRDLGNNIIWDEERKLNHKIGMDNRELLICPHCLKESNNAGVMVRCHFDNCKSNPDYEDKRVVLVCPHCGFESRNPANIKQNHFDNCKQNPDYIPKERLKIICPHCGKRSSTQAIYLKHLENCKHK